MSQTHTHKSQCGAARGRHQLGPVLEPNCEALSPPWVPLLPHMGFSRHHTEALHGSELLPDSKAATAVLTASVLCGWAAVGRALLGSLA